MLKAVLSNGTVLLGLSAMNVELLKVGRPIDINLASIGLPDRTIVIFYGETEESMKAQVLELTGVAGHG